MSLPVFIYRCRDYELVFDGHAKIMGILNTTPDSFSDGGRYRSVDKAVEKGLAMVAEGADILDIGGESTRPGYTPVAVEEEIRRVVPVIEELKRQTSVPISIDTSKGAVAEAAVAAGAAIVNDVTGFEVDFEAKTKLLRRTGAGCVLMHWRDMQAGDDDGAIGRYLAEQARHVEDACGMDASRVMLDPGIGFGKTQEQNLSIVRHTAFYRQLGYPVLIGPSRKSFVRRVLENVGEACDVQDASGKRRLWGTAGAVAVAGWLGADVVRVHDVAVMRDVVRMVESIRDCQDRLSR